MTYSDTNYGYTTAADVHPAADADEVTPGDIEHTRAEMSDTLAALGEKLSPHHLAEEAKDAVLGAAKDTATHAKDAAVEIVQHIRDTLPEIVSEAAHHLVHGIVHESKTVWSGAVGTSKDALGGAVESAKGASMSVLDNIKQNPLAAAFVGVGLYLLFNKGGDTKSASIPAVGYVPGGTSSFPNSAATSSVAGAAQSVGSAVSNAAANVSDKVGDLTGQVQDAAGNLAHQVQDKTSQVAGQVQSTVSDAVGTVQGKAQAAVETVQDKAQAGTDFFQRSLQENPLAVGGVAVALGMAIALAIPETAPEHKLMGAAKDNLVQKAADAAHGLGDKISSVASDTLSSVKESAHNQGLTA